MSSWKKFWGMAALGLFFAAIFLFSVNSFKESDSFYHLKTGQVIVETHTIPHADIFSYTAAGASWFAHEWLAEVIFYLVFRAFGFWGVMFFVALLSMLTCYCMYKTARLRGFDRLTASGGSANATLFLFIIGGLLTFELWIGRPQIFSYLFLALLIYLLERYRKFGKPWILAMCLGILILWTNMHASIVLGLAVLFLYAGIDFIKIILSPSQRKERKKILLFATALVGILVCLLNPEGYKIFLYSRYIGNAVQSLRVSEWLPITVFFSFMQTKVLLAMMFIVDGILLWWYGFRKQTRDYHVLALAFGVSILPFISIRHVGYFSITTLPFFAAPLTEFFGSRLKNIPEHISHALWTFVAILLFLMSVIHMPHRYFNDQAIPVHAADFMEQKNIPGPLFNLYNEGGYYIFRGRKVFIDGRSEVYGPAQIEELRDVVNASSSFDDVVNKKYSINIFALAYRPQNLNDAIRPLVIKLFQEHWRLVWWDDAAIIFVRDIPENADLIKNYALYHVNPFRSPAGIPSVEVPAALKELNSLLDRSPANTVIQDYIASLLPSAYFKHPSTP